MSWSCGQQTAGSERRRRRSRAVESRSRPRGWRGSAGSAAVCGHCLLVGQWDNEGGEAARGTNAPAMQRASLGQERPGGLEQTGGRPGEAAAAAPAVEWLSSGSRVAHGPRVARRSLLVAAAVASASSTGVRAGSGEQKALERAAWPIPGPTWRSHSGRAHARTHTRVNDMPPRPAAAGCSPCLRRDAAGCRCSSCTETGVGERTCQSAVVRLVVVVVVVVVVFGSWVLRSSAVESSQRHQSRQRVREREWYASRHGSGRGAGPVFWTVGGRACTVPGEGPGVRGGE
ncbi:hypothetical protein BS50DRAFT_78467 [Corynespora cassiicola Philippines]|uniref:Uncharacterized protein n=1 Tax=Corynespora cassiicola Philippines TaxID=1448308 RepID=A0A2T2NGR0_CORCC|nr:hypothetical protein BS50DRAFT_78467 [Corynespora cassiicola Philippines]